MRQSRSSESGHWCFWADAALAALRPVNRNFKSVASSWGVVGDSRRSCSPPIEDQAAQIATGAPIVHQVGGSQARPARHAKIGVAQNYWWSGAVEASRNVDGLLS